VGFAKKRLLLQTVWSSNVGLCEAKRLFGITARTSPLAGRGCCTHPTERATVSDVPSGLWAIEKLQHYRSMENTFELAVSGADPNNEDRTFNEWHERLWRRVAMRAV
jgi:hypothetical protein